MSIIDSRITLDPNLIICCGNHRMRILETNHEKGHGYRQTQKCVLCGWTVTRPDHEPFVDCEVKP